MRALVIDHSGVTLRRDYPDPVATAGESLVRVTMAGICGTDLELVRGYMGYRGVPGHEFVGIVTASADRALIGKRVVGEINAACGSKFCDFCRQGLDRHCPSRTVLGILGRDGAFAEYLSLPDDNLVPVPATIPDEVAVFIEPLAAAYEIFEQISLDRHENILVLGDGRLGTLVAMALRAEGYRPQIGGHHDVKLEFLARLGFEVELEEKLKPRFPTVVDCTGKPDGLARAIELTRPRGRIILKSTAAADAAINLAPIVVNEISVIGSRCGRFVPAVEALNTSAVDPRPLISATYSFDDALTALAAARDPLNLKCLLRMI